MENLNALLVGVMEVDRCLIEEKERGLLDRVFKSS